MGKSAVDPLILETVKDLNQALPMTVTLGLLLLFVYKTRGSRADPINMRSLCFLQEMFKSTKSLTPCVIKLFIDSKHLSQNQRECILHHTNAVQQLTKLELTLV